ncbi:MAG TPA: hypothetical protein VHM28_08420 [Anaerolineales bacterium]|nr:hypothetical protein [Anaerolineales bacterium]
MNRKLVLFVLAAFVLPIFLRFIWFFPGFNLPRSISTPDYQNLQEPQAPISTPKAENVSQKGGAVLFDYAHSNLFQPSEIQSLTDALTARGAQVEWNASATDLAMQLKSASAYVIISPQTVFTANEISLLRDFERRGGRLAVFTDATRGQTQYDFSGNPVVNVPDANNVNPLLEDFGLSVNGDYLYNLVSNEGNFRNVYFESFGKSDLTWGLSKVALYGAHSVESDSGLALLVGNDKTLSSETDATPDSDPKKGWAAAALSQDGDVLAVGDFTFMMTPYDTVGDNGVFISNIADFLLGGSRRVALENYPFVFHDSTVTVLRTSDVQMTAELTGALSRLQASFRSINVELKLATDAPSDGDLIVLGTFSPSDDLDKYVKPFNIPLDSFSEFVDTPQFGKLGRSGNGLLLFQGANRGNTLTLLADSVDDLTSLMDTLSSGDLSGCVIQRFVAACSIGFGGSFSEGGGSEPAFPEGTPTPSG